MADEPTVTPPIPPLAEISSAMAPIIYFEAAPNFGFNHGICSIALEAATYVNLGTEIRAERRVVAHLRMTPNGLANLKSALDGLAVAIAPFPAGGEAVN
jgi:hypothetical protein